MASSPPRIAVFIDWQNAYKAAREAFGLRSLPNELGNFSPFKLARILAAGHGRDEGAALVRVEVHRGLPSRYRWTWCATNQPGDELRLTIAGMTHLADAEPKIAIGAS